MYLLLQVKKKKKIMEKEIALILLVYKLYLYQKKGNNIIIKKYTKEKKRKKKKKLIKTNIITYIRMTTLPKIMNRSASTGSNIIFYINIYIYFLFSLHHIIFLLYLKIDFLRLLLISKILCITNLNWKKWEIQPMIYKKVKRKKIEKYEIIV